MSKKEVNNDMMADGKSGRGKLVSTPHEVR